MTDFLTLREMQAFAATILEKASAFSWSVQGFGMFRLYLSKDVRLHVWDDRFKVPNVTEWHDHPWDFDSTILCGTLKNEIASIKHDATCPNYLEGTITCGKAGSQHGEEIPVFLDISSVDVYHAGQKYWQRASTVHRTSYVNGTVTVCKRQFHLNTEEAHVYYPDGTNWVSAEPRTATELAVAAMREIALVRLKESLL